jgi:hypothetical protein
MWLIMLNAIGIALPAVSSTDWPSKGKMISTDISTIERLSAYRLSGSKRADFLDS